MPGTDSRAPDRDDRGGSARLPAAGLRAVLLCLLVPLTLTAGCKLLSATFRIAHDVQTSPSQSLRGEVPPLVCDLGAEKDFQDNRDRIRSIDAAGLVFRATNNSDSTAACEIWMSPTRIDPPTAEAIRGSAQARRVLGGLELPPHEAVDLSFERSQVLEENVDFLDQTVRQGVFYLYGLMDQPSFDLTLERMTVVVVFTIEY